MSPKFCWGSALVGAHYLGALQRQPLPLHKQFLHKLKPFANLGCCLWHSACTGIHWTGSPNSKHSSTVRPKARKYAFQLLRRLDANPAVNLGVGCNILSTLASHKDSSSSCVRRMPPFNLAIASCISCASLATASGVNNSTCAWLAYTATRAGCSDDC